MNFFLGIKKNFKPDPDSDGRKSGCGSVTLKILTMHKGWPGARTRTRNRTRQRPASPAQGGSPAQRPAKVFI